MSVDEEDNRYKAMVAYSDDLGGSWSDPVTVNDNTNEGEPANPALAVNSDGVLGVTFNDRRDSPGSDCYTLYFAASVDGGETFLPNVNVSGRLTCPNSPGNWAPSAFSFLDIPLDRSENRRLPTIGMTTVPGRFANGGDTQGLAAASDGSFHAAWIGDESGVMQLKWNRFTVDPSAIPTGVGEEREDLSTQLTLEVSEPAIDFENQAVTIDIRLVNPLPHSVEGPFTVVVETMQSAMEELTVGNADNGLAGKGAAWDFEVPALGPGGESEVRTFRFDFSGGVPEEPGEPLRAAFVILGRKKT
jgi:hypothetical protein